MKKPLLAIVLILAVGYSYAQTQIITTGNNLIDTTNPYAGDIVIGSDKGVRHDGSIMWWSSGSAARISLLNNIFKLSVWSSSTPNISLDPTVGSSSYFLGGVGVGTSNPLNKFVVNAGENNKSIEISGGSFPNDPSIHYFPALSFYAQQSSVRQVTASSEIVFSDRPGTSGYPTLARSSDMLFYTAHSYNPGTNTYGCYPDLSMVIKSTQKGGYVGIGTANPDQRLTVSGTIHASEVLVDQTVSQPDYVFDKGYDLTSLRDVKTYIDQNHHLPEIPSAAQVAKEGINLGEMNTKLLKKIEELTLYLIEKDNQISASEMKNQELEHRLEILEKHAPHLVNPKKHQLSIK